MLGGGWSGPVRWVRRNAAVTRTARQDSEFCEKDDDLTNCTENELRLTKGDP